MRIVVALGGNALLKRGEPLTVQAQRANIKIAAPALAKIAINNELIITHGNGYKLMKYNEKDSLKTAKTFMPNSTFTISYPTSNRKRFLFKCSAHSSKELQTNLAIDVVQVHVAVCCVFVELLFGAKVPDGFVCSTQRLIHTRTKVT